MPNFFTACLRTVEGHSIFTLIPHGKYTWDLNHQPQRHKATALTTEPQNPAKPQQEQNGKAELQRGWKVCLFLTGSLTAWGCLSYSWTPSLHQSPFRLTLRPFCRETQRKERKFLNIIVCPRSESHYADKHRRETLGKLWLAEIYMNTQAH